MKASSMRTWMVARATVLRAWKQFQTDPSCRLFLISLKAGGLGLNLTAAECVPASIRGGTPPWRRRRLTARTGSVRRAGYLRSGSSRAIRWKRKYWNCSAPSARWPMLFWAPAANLVRTLQKEDPRAVVVVMGREGVRAGLFGGGASRLCLARFGPWVYKMPHEHQSTRSSVRFW